MFEIMPLDYKKWDSNTVSPEDFGIALATDETRTILHRYSTPDGSQQFNVLEVDGRPNDQEGHPVGIDTISSTPWSYRIDPLFTDKMAILAKQRGVRVFASEIPGVTINQADPFNNDGARLTREQSRALLRGNFGPIARTQFEAIRSYANFTEGQEVAFYGESMAVGALAAMIREMSDGTITPLTIAKAEFNEPVNVFGDTTLLQMYKLMIRLGRLENTRRGLYIQENAQIGYPEAMPYEDIDERTAAIDTYVKGMRQQGVSALITGVALRKGMHTVLADIVAKDTAYYPITSDSEIMFGRGADSSANEPGDFESLNEYISGSRVKVRMLEFTDGETDGHTPIGHSFTDSLGRAASMATLLR